MATRTTMMTRSVNVKLGCLATRTTVMAMTIKMKLGCCVVVGDQDNSDDHVH